MDLLWPDGTIVDLQGATLGCSIFDPGRLPLKYRTCHLAALKGVDLHDIKDDPKELIRVIAAMESHQAGIAPMTQ